MFSGFIPIQRKISQRVGENLKLFQGGGRKYGQKPADVEQEATESTEGQRPAKDERMANDESRSPKTRSDVTAFVPLRSSSFLPYLAFVIRDYHCSVATNSRIRGLPLFAYNRQDLLPNFQHLRFARRQANCSEAQKIRLSRLPGIFGRVLS